MKRLLLSLISMLVIGSAWADGVTPTDLTTFDDVIYANSSTVLRGTASFNLPIYVKSHQNFTAVDFSLVLPDGATVKDLNGIEQSRRRYEKTSGSDVYEYNQQSDGSYRIIGTGTCDRGYASGDDVYSYVTIDISGLEAGEYPLIIKNTTIDGFMDPDTGVKTGEASAVISNEITTTLTITDCLVFNETATELPGYEANATAKVIVNRNIEAGKWNTIVLPFKLSKGDFASIFGSDAEVATFNSWKVIDEDEDIIPEAIEINFATYKAALLGLAAGTPYLIKTSKSIETFEVDNVTLVKEVDNIPAYDELYKQKGVFTGSFVKTVVPENGLFISNGKFYYSVGKTNIKGFRGWFVLDAILNKEIGSAKIGFCVDGVATGIEDLHTIAPAEGIYDLSGRKIKVEGDDLSRLPKGVYIVDGKKVTVK